MRSEDVTMLKPYTRTRIQCDRSTAYKPIVTDMDVYSDVTYISKVESGAVVQGNFKDPNPWSYKIQRISGMTGSCRTYSVYTPRIYTEVHYDGAVGTVSGEHLAQFFGDLTFPDSNLYNRALGKLNDQVRGSLDLTVDLAEAGQTAKMLNLLRRAQNIVLSANWRAIVRGASNARAEWAYGWSPLMKSIYGVADEMQRTCQKHVERFRVSVSDAIGPRASAIPVYGYGPLSAMLQRSGRRRVLIQCDVTPTGFDPARWGSLNPVSIGYELMPYSFVLDWFLDVGGYLRNYETSLLYATRFRSGFVSELCSASAAFDAFGRYSSGSYPVNTAVATLRAAGKFVQFQRTKLNAYPAPRLPHFSADLSSGRLLNLAALMGQKVKAAL